ncbi:MAG: DUF4156 domain-containing protein [Chromatiales bacterium]|jgi:hypothetical protein|nr:DUF4156 domain-containing protein [Chromatiales bacterium]MDX9768404.1 DUF4156 domain-containing protein [Ectothiorhodospiraceae bacterium]
MKRAITLSALVLPLMLGACAWVKTTDSGEKVRVLEAREAAQCRHLGSTTVSVADRIAGIPRNEGRVQTELQVIARNSGAEMGGDTVVPVTPIEDGRQTYEVYRCVNQ